jgi:hypothetical protein
MKKVFFLFCFFCVLVYSTQAQVLPKEGSELRYRLIGFYFPDAQPAAKYNLEIAAGKYGSEDVFKKNIIKVISGDKNSVIAEVPYWGTEYTWRVVSGNDGSSTARSSFHYFKTSVSPKVDTSRLRVRIAKATDGYKDAFFFLDGNEALYDMNGRVVWFMPDRGDTAPNVIWYG